MKTKQAKTKTEIVTLSFDVALEYVTDEGREFLLNRLKQNGPCIDMAGGGNCGAFGMKSDKDTAKITVKGSRIK